MPTADAKFARFRNKSGHFAEVAVEVELGDEPSAVAFDCTGEGWKAQGYVENVSAAGGGYHDAWKLGARAGALFALLAVAVTARVRVIRISGLLTDTNPSIVAAAAAFAVWKALSVSAPPQDAVERLESVAFESWKRDANTIPEL